ncbi:alpha-galactosidase [Microbacterium sp. GXF7504]
MHTQPTLAHLSAEGSSLVVDTAAGGILHWGPALTEQDAATLAATDAGAVTFSSFDAPRRLGLLPVEADGWSGTPALSWHRDGAASAPMPVLTDATATADAVVLTYRDELAQAEARVHIALGAGGALQARVEVTSTAPADAPPLDLTAARIVVPLPARAAEILDHTGRWTGERRPQRLPVRDGAHTRTGRRGRGGHDAAYVSLVGTEGFGFRHGEVWAAHVAWSGDTEVAVERLPEGAGVHAAVLAAGELLRPGEIRLASGETYRSPVVHLAHSTAGIDGVTARFHRAARALPGHPGTPRPLVLNTWEAVYFDHDPARIAELARVAAGVGVERFVLDDGWFGHRPDDRSGLGDWHVDTAKWPDGLRPLADLVHGLGMQFGLWFEPEMVNPDSDLARAHPEWILGTHPDPATWRHQLVLDLTHPDARAHVLDRLDDAITAFDLDFIKWDHNRDLHAAVSRRTGRAASHAQTAAFYALLDDLRARHPRLEIESCASGGARVDLGVLARTQRVWASDSNDPVERQRIQRWTATLVPPEVVGSHVGPPVAETTHRSASLSFRMTTALFGHAGLEWDLTTASPAELDALRAWSTLYRELRPLLHAGVTVRTDEPDPGTLLHGVVADDRSHAVFAWVRTDTSSVASTPRTRIPGLDPDARYTVRERTELGRASRHEVRDPAWLEAPEPLVATGRFLAEAGLPLPLLDPGAAMLLEFRRAEAGGGAY